MTKRLAIVENGKVVNTIVGEVGFAGGIECSADVSIGWSHDGTKFSAPEAANEAPTADDVDRHLDERLGQFSFDGHTFPLTPAMMISLMSLGYLAGSSPNSISGLVLYDSNWVGYALSDAKNAQQLVEAASLEWFGQQSAAASIKGNGLGSIAADFKSDIRWAKNGKASTK